MSESGTHAWAGRDPLTADRTTDSRHGLPVAGDVLARGFELAGPDAARSADITDVPTAEGWLHLAVVEDLFSRRIVGWAMDAAMTIRLVVDALDTTLGRRRPGPGPLAHSDRGSRYASEHYRGLLARHGVTCGMSGVAQCWDDAPVESFFASPKKEPVHDGRHAASAEARASIFEYVESFYNRVRLHSSLGFVSQPDFERTHNPNRAQFRRHFPSGSPAGGLDGVLGGGRGVEPLADAVPGLLAGVHEGGLAVRRGDVRGHGQFSQKCQGQQTGHSKSYSNPSQLSACGG